MASQITSLMIVYSTAYSGVHQRKHQSYASLAFVRGIHRWPVNSPHERASNAENVSIWWRHHAMCHGHYRMCIKFSFPVGFFMIKIHTSAGWEFVHITLQRRYMSVIVSQTTSNSIVCSTVWSGGQIEVIKASHFVALWRAAHWCPPHTPPPSHTNTKCQSCRKRLHAMTSSGFTIKPLI